VVIRGETYHFEIVANESARGLMALTLDGLAVGNGILTVEDEAQARRILKLMEALDDHDDVQNVWSNFDIPDELLVEA
ncbi:MAG: 6,7-dimethyl-8-ribityllumazine synthase, partial [Acidobacteria bacterium]|nr:6,7-dimethyl-8-ribityllumazine synthase [Acidobacteriota bacterium]